MSQKKIFYYNTKDAQKEFTLNIKLNTECRIYFNTNELPEEIVKASNQTLKQGNNFFDEYSDLSKLIYSLIEDFELTFVDDVKSKVIIYILNTESDDEKQKIDLRYKVVTKIVANKKSGAEKSYYTERLLVGGAKTNNGTKQSFMYDFFNSYHYFNSDDFLEMDHTPERELWFENTLQTMSELADKIRHGFGNKAQVLASKIDKNKDLLNSLLITKKG